VIQNAGIVGYDGEGIHLESTAANSADFIRIRDCVFEHIDYGIVIGDSGGSALCRGCLLEGNRYSQIGTLASLIQAGAGCYLFEHWPNVANSLQIDAGSSNNLVLLNTNANNWTVTDNGASDYQILTNSTTGSIELKPRAKFPIALMDQYIEGSEISDPAAPAADKGRLYFKDVGGKTALMARFPTGAVQQIAIEP
jgi:hypothetical protein